MAKKPGNHPVIIERQSQGTQLTNNDRTRQLANLTPYQISLHRNFLNSLQSLKSSLLRTAFYLEAIKRNNIHKLLGYKTIGRYAENWAGISTATTTELLRMASRLPDFPLVARALLEEKLTWSQARDICTRTNPAEQEKWIEIAARIPRRSLREAIKRAQEPAPGVSDPNSMGKEESPKRNRPANSPRKSGRIPTPTLAPTPTAPDSPTWHYTTFKFTAEQKARFDSLFEVLQKAAPGPREETLLSALDGATHRPADTSPPPYLVTLIRCPDCGQTTIPTAQGETPAPPPLITAAGCDAIIEDENGRRASIIPPRLRRQALQRARYRCQAGGCRSTRFLEIHHRRPVAQGGTHQLDNLVVLCWRCHRALHAADEAAKEAAAAAP